MGSLHRLPDSDISRHTHWSNETWDGNRNYTTIIPVLRQRTDTPGSAPVDFLRKNAIFLSKSHSWQGSESLLSRGSPVRVRAGAPNIANKYRLLEAFSRLAAARL